MYTDPTSLHSPMSVPSGAGGNTLGSQVPGQPGFPCPAQGTGERLSPLPTPQPDTTKASDKGLDSRGVQTSGPEQLHFNLPDLTKHKDIVMTLAGKQQLDKTIEKDQESLYSMASALCAADIHTVEDANALGLRIVPPGPVFHTWYALRGTTLFNGKNNAKGYDYVQLIEKEAEHLRQFDLPVLLVYSTLGMTDDQITEMQGLFRENDNIVSICLEADFPGHLMTCSLATEAEAADEYSVEPMDHIRYVVLLYRQKILYKALEKAFNEGKALAIANLSQCLKSVPLVYSDIDNVLIRPGLYMLSGPGIIPSMHPYSSMHLDKHFVETLLPNRPDIQPKHVQDHNSYVSHLEDQSLVHIHDIEQARSCNDKLHSALLGGYLQDNFARWFLKSAKTSERWRWTRRERIAEDGIFKGEVNYFRASAENTTGIDLDDALKCSNYMRLIFLKKTATALSSDQQKMSMLLGMQQLKSHLVNYHNSWSPNTAKR